MGQIIVDNGQAKVVVVRHGGIPGATGPTGPQGNAGTSTAPSYAYASLPSASPAGQIARVTDNARGLWMSDGTTWNKVTNTIDLWDWAEPSDSVDQTSEIQDWIDAVHTYRLPGFGSGTYLTSGGLVTTSGQTDMRIYGPQGGWGAPLTFLNRTDSITLRMDGGNSSIEHVMFDGRSALGDNAGGIGLVLGPNHKITARNIVCRNFREAGFVADGTQNSLFENIDSFFNKINIWITNECRTCLLLNPNATDSDLSINTYMDGIDPDGVELWVGRRTNSYITMKTDAVDTPGDLTVFHGILERHVRHDYNVRISNGWGYLRLVDLNIQGAKTALIRIDANVNLFPAPLRLILDNITPQNVDAASAAVPTISNANGDTGLEIFSTVSPGFTSWNKWFATRVKETMTTEDYGQFQHILAAPPTFGHNIGEWISQGGVPASTVTHTNRRLRIGITAAGFGGTCNPSPKWTSPTFSGSFVYTANHVIKVKGYVTAMAPTDVVITAGLIAAPLRRDIGHITAVGAFEFTYLCQGDESGVIEAHAFGGAGSGDIDFSELAATVY
jgi:hypothetical protein